MKFIAVLFLLAACVHCHCENLRFTQFGSPIPACPKLEVHWKVPSNALPTQMSVYHLLPNHFSPAIVDTLRQIGGFPSADQIHSESTKVEFKSRDGARHLTILFRSGVVYYDERQLRGPSNLVAEVPNVEQAVELTKNLLPQLGIPLGELEQSEKAAGPSFRIGQAVSEYYINHETVTNIESRRVSFRRAVDGAAFLGAGTGGGGEIHFGERGRVIHIDLSWRTLERKTAFKTFTPAQIIEAIQHGHATQGLLSTQSAGINWKTASDLIIKNARACYYAGNPIHSTDWLYPFAALSTTVSMENGNIDVEVDSPLIDDEKSMR